MAMELFSESPRISFSHDLSQFEVVPIEQRQPYRSNSPSNSTDFDFCVRKSSDQEYNYSSADELFSDGKMLPTQIKKKNKTFPPNQTNPSPSPSPSPPDTNSHVKTENPDKLDNGEEAGQNKQSNSKSFWKFKKSRSLNCGSGYGRGLCPLPLLSRSNSTGSAPNSAKRPPLISKDTQKQSTQRTSSSSSIKSSQKPPLNKSSCVSSYGNNGVRVNPVLNVSSGNLFGLGSTFFHGNKERSKKK
ncbi:hypothetical protein HS088_TW05G00744 [Tripterygium wilfordii]|uniref:Uncharacterized protein n=1 Tax=Tripterygium wilfordii TaxID=458696 RepID=A0A7J7DNR2_TRIWF|nr:uncharacterized protein LOC119999024 [Tripterygium wilfordii]KAF5748012.1 hypothetical protein HS088_TW05G00744 [Tripterygium wilfordii]